MIARTSSGSRGRIEPPQATAASRHANHRIIRSMNHKVPLTPNENAERDVLPFHQLGRYKWKQLGMNYRLETTEPPSHEMVEHIVGIFRAAGLTAH